MSSQVFIVYISGRVFVRLELLNSWIFGRTTDSISLLAKRLFRFFSSWVSFGKLFFFFRNFSISPKFSGTKFFLILSYYLLKALVAYVNLCHPFTFLIFLSCVFFFSLDHSCQSFSSFIRLFKKQNVILLILCIVFYFINSGSYHFLPSISLSLIYCSFLNFFYLFFNYSWFTILY